jgi:hypothetical protein
MPVPASLSLWERAGVRVREDASPLLGRAPCGRRATPGEATPRYRTYKVCPGRGGKTVAGGGGDVRRWAQ